MRYPHHIILDVTKSSQESTTQYWVNTYKPSLSRNYYYNTTLRVVKSIEPALKSITTTHYSTTSLNQRLKSLYTSTGSQASSRYTSSLLWSLFDVNFMKREKIYTKLKYSRSPAYDIVSGGVAAMFAGFIGFLISEKFGIELVDSGDFYIFFMYCVFGFFSLRPLVKIASRTQTFWHILTYKFLVNYFYTLLTMLWLELLSLTRTSWTSTTLKAVFSHSKTYLKSSTASLTIAQHLSDAITYRITVRRFNPSTTTATSPLNNFKALLGRFVNK